MFRKDIIIDCDAGIDDALALIILLGAHKQKEINIKAITCVNGNTTVDNVVKNVFRTLHTCNVTDIPVFQGAYGPLLNTPNAHATANEKYHGTDGFGDVYPDDIDVSKVQKEHAVCALNRIVLENPDKVTLVVLGPMTNIALATKMYPDFLENVKELFVMGGNSAARGNVTSQAEFNFYADPESVHIVLNSNKKPLWLLPWETCLLSKISHDWRKNVFGQIDKPCVHLMNKIEHGRSLTAKKHFPNYITCDAILAGILLKPEIAKDTVLYHADIELHGNRTRGQVVLDHLLSNEPNIKLIQEIDSDIFKELLMHCVEHHESIKL